MTKGDILEARYSELQRRMPLVEGPQYASLVVPNGNQEMSVHRWFHLKEAFSGRLMQQVLKDIELNSRNGLRILDPYAGVGTSCVSLAEAVRDGELRSASAYGLEANGFLHLVAAAKLACYQRPPSNFLSFAAKIGKVALSLGDAPPAPPLATFHTPAYFDHDDLAQLMRLKWAIGNAEGQGAEPLDVALARVCLGAIIEPVSNLRRDGRALRYTQKRSRPPTVRAFLDKARQVSEDLPKARVAVRGRVIRGDGRLLQTLDRGLRPFNLVLFSPPYPNNIDYTEVYKLENWLLGYIADPTSFVEQRLQTVYSHPSVLRTDPLPSNELTEHENSKLLTVTAPLTEAVPSDRYAEGRRRMLRGYALDMYLTLRSATKRVVDDGWIVYIVGNSIHGRGPDHFIIAADLLLSELANLAGLTVERVVIARHLRRRFVASPFLRESVVFLRRR